MFSYVYLYVCMYRHEGREKGGCIRVSNCIETKRGEGGERKRYVVIAYVDKG